MQSPLDLIGVADLDELLLRLLLSLDTILTSTLTGLVLRILVRMPFHGQLPVGLLDLLLGSPSRDSQGLVEVTTRLRDPPSISSF